MSGRERVPGWWPAILISLGLHLIPLFGAHLDFRPRYLPLRAPTPVQIRYWPAPPPVRSATAIPAPSAPSVPRRITIERQRRIHLPPAREPVRPPPAPREAPVSLAPRPELPAPREPVPPPVVAALRHSTDLAGASVPVGDRSLRLRFPLSFMPLEGEAPAVILAAEPTPPAPEGGIEWRELPADHRLYHRPHEVAEWWRAWDAPPARVGRREGRVVALWLPPLVRAGWEAEHPDALAFWDNLAAWAGAAGLLTAGGEGVRTDLGGTFAPLEE